VDTVIYYKSTIGTRYVYHQ